MKPISGQTCDVSILIRRVTCIKRGSAARQMAAGRTQFRQGRKQ